MAGISRAELQTQMNAAKAAGERNARAAKFWHVVTVATKVVGTVAGSVFLVPLLSGCAGAPATNPVMTFSMWKNGKNEILGNKDGHLYIKNGDKIVMLDGTHTAVAGRDFSVASVKTDNGTIALFMDSYSKLRINVSLKYSCGSGTEYILKGGTYTPGNAIPQGAATVNERVTAAGGRTTVAVKDGHIFVFNAPYLGRAITVSY